MTKRIDEIHDRTMGVIRHEDCHRAATEEGSIPKGRIGDGDRIERDPSTRYWRYESDGSMFCDECGETIATSVRSAEGRIRMGREGR